METAVYCPRCDKKYDSGETEEKSLEMLCEHIKRSEREDHADLDWFTGKEQE